MSYGLNSFNVNWDFSDATKINFFAPIITGISSQPQCLSFTEFNGYCFYEIKAIEDTNIYIKEAVTKQAFKDGNNKPFLYIKNIGNCNIYLRASNHNTGIFFNSGFFNFKEERLFNNTSYSGIDYLIAPNENILLTIKSSQDGSAYISKSCLPFGFFYSIKNSNIDEYGYDTCKISGYPTFIYEDISGIDISILNSGNLNDNSFSRISVLRNEDHPSGQGNWSANLQESFEISNTGDNLSFWESGFCNFNINLTYKPKSFPSSFYQLLKIKNANTNIEYLCSGGNGILSNYDYDVFRIDSSGNISIGPSLANCRNTDAYEFACEGFFLNKNFLNCCSTKNFYTGDFSVSFLIKPTIRDFTNQQILNTEKWNFYLYNKAIIYEDKFRNRICLNNIKLNEINQIFFKKSGSSICLNNFIDENLICENDITGSQCELTMLGSGLDAYSYCQLPNANNLNIGYGKCCDFYYQTGSFNYFFETVSQQFGGAKTSVDQSAFTLDSCDYSVELFVKANYTGSVFQSENLLCLHGLQVYGDNSGGVNTNGLFINGSGARFFWKNYIEDNTKFHHLLFTKKGSCLKVFKDGCYISGFVNTGITTGLSRATFSYTPGYKSFWGCISNLRIIKNQALYHDCCQFQQISMPLSLDGYGVFNENQNITGCVAFLGFTGATYPSGMTFYFSDSTTYQKFGSGEIQSSYENLNKPTLSAFYGDFFNLKIKDSDCVILNANTPSGFSGVFKSYDISGHDYASGELFCFTTGNFPEIKQAAFNPTCGFYFLKTSSGLNLNQWNDLNLNVTDVVSGVNLCLDINSTNVLNEIRTYDDSGFFLQNLNFLTGMCSALNCCQLFDKKIITLNSNECGEAINGYISDFELCKNSKCLFIDFDWKNKNFLYPKSFGTSISANKCADYEISFNNSCACIPSCLNDSFKIGCNYNEFFIDISCVEIIDGGNREFISRDNFNFYKKTGTINQDVNICIKYDIETSNNDLKKYIYFYSGFQNEKCHFIYSLTSSEKIIEEPNILNSGYSRYVSYDISGVDEFILNKNNSAIVNLILSECSAIKDFVNQQYDRCDIYINGSQLSCYLFIGALSDVNYCKNTGISGDWSYLENLENFPTENFVNLTSSVSLNDSGYICCCSPIYEYNGFLAENRFSTNQILNKDCFYTSEAYLTIESEEEESLFYCCLEFKYKPIKCIFYDGLYYEIPNCCVPFQYMLSGVTKCINFPLRAFSKCNFKIISDYEIFDKILSSNYSLNYSGFNLNFCNKNQLNFICNKYWKLNSSTTQENPSIELKINYNSIFQKDLQFYFNPFDNILGDRLYCLKNLIFFLLSDINSGIASNYVNYSGLEPENSEYNLFFIDLQQELRFSDFQLPSGFCSILVDNAINFQNYYLNSPSPFKTSNSTYYNYILPITTSIQYCDSVQLANNNCLQNDLSCSGIWNFCSLSVYITGGSTGLIYCSGACTGYCTGFFQNSSLIVSPCDIVLRFPSCDINQWSGNKTFELNKNYTFSGVQPIYISSNYILSEIKSSIVNKLLKPYNYNSCELSGNYYYMYDLLNTGDLKFKFISPEGTKINFVCWSDQDGDQLLTYASTSDAGSLIENVGFLNFKLNSAISNNQYNYSDGNLNIYIDLVGGI
jgi:hypothetical protein